MEGAHLHINAHIFGAWGIMMLKYLSNQAHIQQLGVADFSQAHLTRLMDVISSKEEQLDAKDTDVGGVLSNDCSSNGINVLKRPTIDQLNFDDDLPPELTSLSEYQAISLVSHSDELGKQEFFRFPAFETIIFVFPRHSTAVCQIVTGIQTHSSSSRQVTDRVLCWREGGVQNELGAQGTTLIERPDFTRRA
jgi:hypothetical protein